MIFFVLLRASTIAVIFPCLRLTKLSAYVLEVQTTRKDKFLQLIELELSDGLSLKFFLSFVFFLAWPLASPTNPSLLLRFRF